MGFWSRMNPLSTEGAISLSASTYHDAHPELTFQEALEQSLLETRPGWNQDWIEDLRRFGRLLKANAPEEWVRVAVSVDKAGRAAKKGISSPGIASGEPL